MAGLSGDELPVPPNSHINGEHVGGLVNGDVGTSGQLTSELRNLVSILGRQSDNGISLEQLLSGTSPTRNSITPSAAHQLPTTPSSSRSNNWAGRKRGRPFEPDDSSKRRRVAHTPYSARQSGEKGHGKGLRHFSQRVCEKVRQKGNTTYNEVADELVKELSEYDRKDRGSNEVPIDHKNIRRRVYDALNVLMAMNIISKEKKDIRWIGLPTNSVQECQHIEEEVSLAEQRILEKRSKVEELIVQIISYKNLMKRNRERVSSLGAPAQNTAIGLPFIVVNTNKSTTIDCSISSDKSEYVFSFDNAFELYNDVDILKKMGLDCGLHSGTCSIDNLKVAKTMLPKAFGDTLDEIVLSKHLPVVVDSPQTPVARHLTSLCSTPTTTLSPTLSPFTTPTASSPHVAAIAAVLAQAAAASSSNNNIASATATLLHSSPHRAGLLNQHLASPLRSSLPNNSSTTSFSTPPSRTNIHLSGLSSPSIPLFSDTTITNNNNAIAGRGKAVVPIATKTSLSSPISGAKSILHHHCPLNLSGSSSPLVKSSMVNVNNAMQLGSPIHGSCSSLVVSKSPISKFVTASKVPNSEHINTLLQQLQQNPNMSRLVSTEALQSNGNGTL